MRLAIALTALVAASACSSHSAPAAVGAGLPPEQTIVSKIIDAAHRNDAVAFSALTKGVSVELKSGASQQSIPDNARFSARQVVMGDIPNFNFRVGALVCEAQQKITQEGDNVFVGWSCKNLTDVGENLEFTFENGRLAHVYTFYEVRG